MPGGFAMTAAKQVLGWFEYGLGGLILLVGLIIVSLEILGRGFLGFSLLWSEELSRYLLIWTAYMGAAAATRDGSHIRVEFLLHYLPRRWSHRLEIFDTALCLLFTLTLVYAGYLLVEDSRFLGLSPTDSDLSIPIWVFQLIVPLGFALMSLRLAITLVQQVSGQGPKAGRPDSASPVGRES